MKKKYLLALLFAPMMNAAEFDQYNVDLKVHDQDQKVIISEYTLQMMGYGRTKKSHNTAYAIATCDKNSRSFKSKKYSSGYEVEYLFGNEMSSIKITQFSIDDSKYNFVDGEACQNTIEPIQLEIETSINFSLANNVSKTVEMKSGDIAILEIQKVM
jgi:hypothetical protein